MRSPRGRLLVLMLTTLLPICGCMHPQIMDPYATGFAENEYLVIKITDDDQLGQLWEALPEIDASGRPLPLRWRGTTKILFPTSDTNNKIKTTAQEQIRYAFEQVGASAKFTAAAMADLSATTDAVYKYESKSHSAMHLDMQTLRFAPPAADYMRAHFGTECGYRFAYLSAIYHGTAFVEVLSNVTAAGGGSYAAFEVGGKYYVSKNQHIATTGPIIFQLTPIDPREVGVEPCTPPQAPEPRRLEPLSSSQLRQIKQRMPEKQQGMVE